MGSTSIQLPFLQGNGVARACRRIVRAVRERREIAVLLVHVQGIERLCATVGHVRAGQLIDHLYRDLCSVAREDDAVERIDDRKFAVLLSGLRNRGHVTLAAQKIKRLVQDTVSNNAEQAGLNTTIGVALCPEQGDDPHELMRSAEIASLDGQNCGEPLSFYETQAADRLFTDWGLEDRLAEAINAGDLELFYQPKFDLDSDRLVGAEALMRWHEPEIGAISPDVFIALAEKSGQIVDLTQFAIQRACRDLSAWQAEGADLCAAVNVTPSIIQSPEIIDVLQNGSSIWNVDPATLTMEVTENALMEDPTASHDVLTRIRDFGCRVSIDDFGTGYSSLGYLKQIPADELKIDRSFVMGMLDDPGDYKIVEHSINIAKSFGLNVVAEGIETPEMLEALRKLGCDYAQGYLLGKPMPAAEFAASLGGTISSVVSHQRS